MTDHILRATFPLPSLGLQDPGEGGGGQQGHRREVARRPERGAPAGRAVGQPQGPPRLAQPPDQLCDHVLPVVHQ